MGGLLLDGLIFKIGAAELPFNWENVTRKKIPQKSVKKFIEM
jgi:hypothetical protein